MDEILKKAESLLHLTRVASAAHGTDWSTVAENARAADCCIAAENEAAQLLELLRREFNNAIKDTIDAVARSAKMSRAALEPTAKTAPADDFISLVFAIIDTVGEPTYWLLHGDGNCDIQWPEATLSRVVSDESPAKIVLFFGRPGEKRFDTGAGRVQDAVERAVGMHCRAASIAYALEEYGQRWLDCTVMRRAKP